MKSIRHVYNDGKYDHYVDESGYMYLAQANSPLYLQQCAPRKTNKISEFFTNLIKQFNKK